MQGRKPVGNLRMQPWSGARTFAPSEANESNVKIDPKLLPQARTSQTERRSEDRGQSSQPSTSVSADGQTTYHFGG
jgi:hypothetical protein